MTRLGRALLALVAIASVARARPVAARDPLPVEHVELANGLRVILAPDASATAAVVHVRYAAGAASERPEQAGFTHLVEELLDRGSLHVADPRARIEAVGGWTTTTTTHDHLAITDQVPAHALELALWLEAERMAGLADGITAERLAAARHAVQTEWRQAYVDQPFALATRELQRALWSGPLAPYGAPVLGDDHAVRDAGLEAVRQFARGRLVPNGTTLVVAGHFDAAATRRQIERYFGWIPSRETTENAPVVVEPLHTAITRNVTQPIANVTVAYHGPAFDPAIELAAHVLAGGPSSRLERRLRDAGLAGDVHADVVRERAGELRITVTRLPDDADPAKVAAAIRDEVAALRAHRLSQAEVGRAATAVDRTFLVALENLAVRADLLATWAAFDGQPLLGTWRARLHAVTAADVEGALTRWLADQASVTIIARPEAH